MGILKNERTGRKIEGIIAQQINGLLATDKICPYDIETLESLIEVKSCQVKTKNFKTENGYYYRKGRFIINLNSHEKLREKSQDQNKQAEYIFVLYTPNDPPTILESKRLNINQVDKTLEKATLYTNYTRRKDGMKYALITYTKLMNKRLET